MNYFHVYNIQKKMVKDIGMNEYLKLEYRK